MTLEQAFDIIGTGQPLCVPKDGGAASFAAFLPGQKPIPASPDIVRSLIASGQLTKLTEHGEPPVDRRKPYEGWRNGWRELGWAGEHYDFYLHLQ